jgi:hypothetical protein
LQLGYRLILESITNAVKDHLIILFRWYQSVLASVKLIKVTLWKLIQIFTENVQIHVCACVYVPVTPVCLNVPHDTFAGKHWAMFPI